MDALKQARCNVLPIVSNKIFHGFGRCLLSRVPKVLYKNKSTFNTEGKIDTNDVVLKIKHKPNKPFESSVDSTQVHTFLLSRTIEAYGCTMHHFVPLPWPTFRIWHQLTCTKTQTKLIQKARSFTESKKYHKLCTISCFFAEPSSTTSYTHPVVYDTVSLSGRRHLTFLFVNAVGDNRVKGFFFTIFVVGCHLFYPHILNNDVLLCQQQKKRSTCWVCHKIIPPRVIFSN